MSIPLGDKRKLPMKMKAVQIDEEKYERMFERILFPFKKQIKNRSEIILKVYIRKKCRTTGST